MLRAEVLETRLYFVIINMPLLRAHYVLDAVLSTEGTYCCFWEFTAKTREDMWAGKCGKAVLLAKQATHQTARNHRQQWRVRKKLDSRAPTLPYYRNLLPVFPPNVFARQGETKFFLLSPLSLFLLILSYSVSNFRFVLYPPRLPTPETRHPGLSRCVPQGIGRGNDVYAPGATASTGQSSLCSSHPDDFLFKIHLGGSCVTFIFHPGLLTHLALNNNWPPWELRALMTVRIREGQIFLGDCSPVIIKNMTLGGL